jgi:N-formylglutamate deformylase
LIARLMDLPSPSLPETVAEPPPFRVARPERQTVPLVFASPHSGAHYSAEFLARSRLDPVALRRSEDSFVDELFSAAPEHGAPLLAANFPRVFCDANREPWELDPAMFEGPLPAWVNSASPRVGAGLGTIARVVASGEPVYRHKLPFAEAERRIRGYWQPYHAALAGLIRGDAGALRLLPAARLPLHAGAPGAWLAGADMVLGDAHGTACAPRATRLVEETLAGMGYRVRRNDPYAGGYVTRHYGVPRDGVHALQIEVARSLYMDEARVERAPGLGALRRDLGRLIATLAAADWSFLR